VSRRITSTAPVTALHAVLGRLLWPGLPCTTSVTSTGPRLPRLIRLAVAGRARYLEQFTLERMVRETMALYDEVLA